MCGRNPKKHRPCGRKPKPEVRDQVTAVDEQVVLVKGMWTVDWAEWMCMYYDNEELYGELLGQVSETNFCQVN
jgi:hypothetical protein